MPRKAAKSVEPEPEAAPGPAEVKFEEFRAKIRSFTDTVTVTSRGTAIGVWVPNGAKMPQPVVASWQPATGSVAANVDPETLARRARQARIDQVLRKVAPSRGRDR